MPVLCTGPTMVTVELLLRLPLSSNILKTHWKHCSSAKACFVYWCTVSIPFQMHAVWGPTNPGHEKALRQNTLQKCQGYHFMMSAHSCIFRIHAAAIFWVKYSPLRSARVFLGRPWFCQFSALTWRSKDTRRETRRSGLVFGFRWFPDSAIFSLHKLGMISKPGPSLKIKLVERLLGIGKLLHCGILWAHKCKPTPFMSTPLQAYTYRWHRDWNTLKPGTKVQMILRYANLQFCSLLSCSRDSSAHGFLFQVPNIYKPVISCNCL